MAPLALDQERPAPPPSPLKTAMRPMKPEPPPWLSLAFHY